MSKAFTKEDDEAGFSAPSSAVASIPEGPLRLNATAARRLEGNDEPAVREVLARAEVLAPQAAPERAALGVTVRVRTDDGEERAHRLVTAEEYALLGEGVSIGSPLGRALLGASVGDLRELHAPKGVVQIEVVALEGE